MVCMPAPSSLKEFLVATPFFGGLQEGALGRVMAMMAERTFEAGSTVFKEGESGRSMYIIHRGDLVVYRNGPSGKPVKMVHMGPGAFFGETTLIEMQPRPHTVKAETRAVLYELTTANLYALYKQDVDGYILVLQNINRELCRRIRRADGRIADWADESDDPSTQIRTRDEVFGRKP
jgi:CRP-like cAMP-binding protein